LYINLCQKEDTLVDLNKTKLRLWVIDEIEKTTINGDSVTMCNALLVDLLNLAVKHKAITKKKLINLMLISELRRKYSQPELDRKNLTRFKSEHECVSDYVDQLIQQI